ncbi:uncharacterized protein PAC_15231 [Phialocephala subalpina]|uniref:Uncharacterized protein n=1 Tax=Phialocephala subalpina TaxID=576137 RepID=A0A1L7XJU9_9HELO|nr:uncharacterized protein PAC_15231 [Phialocephala subalpina]
MASMRVGMSRLSAERSDSDIKSADEGEAQQTSGTTRNSGVNRHADSGDLSDDDVDLPPLEEVLKPRIASTSATKDASENPPASPIYQTAMEASRNDTVTEPQGSLQRLLESPGR